jgi:transmembrane sensor
VSKKEFLELLDKYLAGNASPAEEQFLFDVYQQIEGKYEWETPELETLDQLEHKLIERFRQSIQRANVVDLPEKEKNQRLRFNNRVILQIAASLLILLTVTAGYWLYHHSSSETNRIFIVQESKDLITHTNNTSGTEKIIFPDKSFVDLATGSKVVYNKNFSGSLRQVYLIGEGFFQVTRNHVKPFIVYTDRLVAKVLGTSFIVKSGEHNTMASVLVKTGKVSVFKTKEFTAENAKPDLTGGLVLLPNHLADLNAKEELEKNLPNSPEVLKSQGTKNFDFDNTPIDTVFSRLQETYGITIVYDKVKLNSCSLSVKMGKEDFYQKLDLICRTINASYQVRDGNVLVSGPGCTN